MKHLLTILRNSLPIVFLLVIEIWLFSANFTTGTFFTGWDNLMPELNFPANLQRSFFGIWQEYRGLGLLDGMSFAANFVHYIFILLLSTILPQNVLRYFFVFLMHFLGGVGMFVLLKNNILERFNSRYQTLISLAGALFYLLNLVTVQMFYAPYELFLVHFAFLPWLIHYLLKFLQLGKRKDFFLFGLFTFLATPQAHVPTIFISYLFFVLIILGVHLARFRLKSLKRIILILVITGVLNSFWGIPFAYSAINNSKTVMNSKINQMSNENVYLKNKARGDLGDVLFMKGFMLDEVEWKKEDNKISFIMPEWRQYTDSLTFKIISSAILAITLLGLLRVLIRRESAAVPFVISLTVFLVFLATNVFLIGGITEFLRDNSTLFKEVFRFAFTKFSIIFMFNFVILFAIGLVTLLSFRIKNWLKSIILGLVLVGIVIYSFPSFQGHFLFDQLRVNIPNEYLQTFDYFNQQPQSERVALLPQPSYWSWKFYDWGGRGSGFFWYGIKQPTLDRAFDPWSSTNENYYWELNYAIFSKNVKLLEQVFDKYQVSWVVVDQNMVAPASPNGLFYSELDQLITKSDKFSLAVQFGQIKVYKVRLSAPVNNFVFLSSNTPTVAPSYNWNNLDQAYMDQGNYIITADNNNYYPFRSLFTGKAQTDLEFSVEETEEAYIFQKEVPVQYRGLVLKIPDMTDEELVLLDQDYIQGKNYAIPETSFDGKTIKVKVPKIKKEFSYMIDAWIEPTTQKAINCNSSGAGSVDNQVVLENNKKFLQVKAFAANNCAAAYWLPKMSRNLGYLITIESKNVAGNSLHFWLEDLNLKKEDIDTYLPQSRQLTKSIFIQPPMGDQGSGYTIHLDNSSISAESTINDIGLLAAAPIPYRFLTQLSLYNPNNESPSVSRVDSVSHPNPSYYSVQINSTKPQKSLVLSQSFNTGWIALWKDGNSFTPIKEHILINNWENGWILDRNQGEVVIIYLPQILEYLGFGILFGGVILIYIFRKRLIKADLS